MCIFFGDCPFNTVDCEEITPHYKCKHRVIGEIEMQKEHTIPQIAVQGDTVQTLDLAKFKPIYRNRTGEVLKWHHDHTYSVLMNGEIVCLTGYEFNNLNI